MTQLVFFLSLVNTLKIQTEKKKKKEIKTENGKAQL